MSWDHEIEVRARRLFTEQTIKNGPLLPGGFGFLRETEKDCWRLLAQQQIQNEKADSEARSEKRARQVEETGS